MDNKVRGIDQKQEVASKVLWRDTRGFKQKMVDSLEKPENFGVGLVLIGALMFIVPQLFEIWAISFFWLISYVKKKQYALSFRMPQSSGLLDPKDPPMGKVTAGPAQGIAYFGNEKETTKELWFNNSDMRTHILIFGSTGAGKALKMNEKIHTPNGWKLNKNIKVGDFVSTPTGSSLVIGVYPQGMQEIFRINFADDRSIDVSGDHLWEVIDHNGIKSILNTSNIMLNMVNNKYFIPLSGEVEKPLQDNLPLLPYIGGYLLANIKKDNSFSFNNSDSEKYFLELFNNKFNIKKINNLEYTINLENFNIFSKSNVNLYINSSIEQRKDFLIGYFKNKNYLKLYGGQLLFDDIHPELVDSIKEIIYSLGGTAKFIQKNDLYEQLSSHLIIDLSFISKSMGIEECNEKTLEIINIQKLDVLEECQCIKIQNNDGLFITKDYLVTHNTEALLSLAFNSLVQGSGLIYVDGKGENTLFTKIFAMARAMGREDDVLVINYMTGSRDVFGPQKSKLSNTLNPFSSGSSGGLTELLISLMDDGGSSGDMWKGRAISLLSAIMMALVYMRDSGEILLDVDVIREYMILDNIIKLYKTRRDLPNNIRQSIRAYLVSLPGYQENAPKQGETTLEQHGFLQMQFTRILGSLSDSYGYIFRTNLGEVDFWDVVVNRRILVVLLPALEKSQEELGNLGKIIVACLKQMMASGLGSQLEGDMVDIVDTSPTKSTTPFVCVLDEYGYYAVKGAAVMAAQARSLGFSMIFAGQDLPAFEKASKEEAASIVANCNVKIFMKLEDPKDTFELFEKSVGEAYVTNVSGFQQNTGGLFSNFQGQQNANVELKKRGNLLDLKDQREGDAHIIFKSAVVRAKMFYAAPPRVKKTQLNYFLKVESPDKKEIETMDSGIKELLAKITNLIHLKEVEESIEDDDENISDLAKIVNSSDNLLPMELGCAAVYSVSSKLNEALKESVSAFVDDDDDEEDAQKLDVFSKNLEKKEFNRNNNDDDDEDDDDDINIFLDEDETKNGMEEIERLTGSDQRNAKENANKIVEDMKRVSEYPSAGVPEDREPEEIMDMLRELDESFELEEDD